MRRIALTLVLILLLLFPSGPVAAARPRAGNALPCTLDVQLTTCPTQAGAGSAITVQWQITSPSIETCTHNSLHWMWYDAQGERTPHETANQPGLAGTYSATINAPSANGYIEVQAHVWTGRCSDITERQVITVGSPPARRYMLRLPHTGGSRGLLPVSDVVTSNANGVATVTVLGQEVQSLVTSMEFEPVAGAHVVAAAAGGKILLVASDPGLDYAPGYIEASLPISGSQVLPIPILMLELETGRALYSTLIPVPTLLAGFARSEACLGPEGLARMATPGRAVFLILSSTGGVSLAYEIVGGVLSTEATATAIATQWAAAGMPDKISARIWSHHDIPVIFVESLGSCEEAS